MKAGRTQLSSLVLTTVALALPGSAGAAPVVPPGNSAATQYTEAFPTAGGPRATAHAPRERNPADVLGKSKARRLEANGEPGQAVAELVAQTAPTSLGRHPAETDSRPSPPANRTGNAHAADPSPAEKLDGSSGLGEVVLRATGSSNSQGMGLLLPLLILGTLFWAVAYWVKQRRQTAA